VLARRTSAPPRAPTTDTALRENAHASWATCLPVTSQYALCKLQERSSPVCPLPLLFILLTPLSNVLINTKCNSPAPLHHRTPRRSSPWYPLRPQLHRCCWRMVHVVSFPRSLLPICLNPLSLSLPPFSTFVMKSANRISIQIKIITN